jgi:hypothetical protein
MDEPPRIRESTASGSQCLTREKVAPVTIQADIQKSHSFIDSNLSVITKGSKGLEPKFVFGRLEKPRQKMLDRWYRG